MVDCDWMGSCIPNDVTPVGSTVTTSAGGAKGESVMGCTSRARAHRSWGVSSWIGGDGERPAPTCLGFSQRVGEFLGQPVGRAEPGGQYPGPLVRQVGGDLPGEAHAAMDLDARPSVGDRRLVGQQLGTDRG